MYERKIKVKKKDSVKLQQTKDKYFINVSKRTK